MPLDKTEVAHLKRMLKEAQKKDRYFAYVQESQDGEPVLFITKKPSEATKLGRAAKQTAAKKILVSGSIRSLGGSEVAFVTENPKKGKLDQALKKFFGKKVPPIKKALCMTPEEFEAARGGAREIKGAITEAKGKAAAELQAVEAEIEEAAKQLMSDASQLSSDALDQLSQRVAEYKGAGGDTDYGPVLALVQKTKKLRKGAAVIEKRVAAFGDMKKDIIKRFKAIQSIDGAAVQAQQAIIDEVKAYIDELKRLKAKYEDLAA